MSDSIAPGQQATAGKEVPKGPGNDGPIPFERKGAVKPSGPGWGDLKNMIASPGSGINSGNVRSPQPQGRY